QIDQSACNKDYSCMNGFCPSFVTLEGGRVKKGRAQTVDASRLPPLPAPTLPSTAQPWGILVTGVGGTGVVTIGALIGMAAHLDGKGVTVLDMTGLAQKGGSVFSHIRIADRPDDLHAVRIAVGEANAVIGGDMVVTASVDALSRMAVGTTRGVVDCSETPTSEFARNPDWQFPLEKMQAAIVEAVGTGGCDFLDAHKLATALMGDAIATNLFLLGYAWQKGWVPVSAASLDKAIVLNGAAVETNRQTLLWGRRAAIDPAAVERVATPAPAIPLHPETLDERIARRAAILTDYQDAAYARRYLDLVARVRAAETPLGSRQLTEAVVANHFKLLAYKDEYEVARLFSDPAFRAQIEAGFEGDFKLRFHLAPTFLARPDPASGRIKKIVFGPWMETAFRWLARFRRLRGTPFDIFGYHPERRAERALIGQYEADIALLLEGLTPERLPLAIEIARLPDDIRGYGHIKAWSMKHAAEKHDALRARWRNAERQGSQSGAHAA
ncbi:MAG TPA: 2-oxoacid:acceptor oxidoreductase family protein, partial [Zoogloea sp.]|nr:2-oxoacid:acceptor oxidoreductase family protein [Zoogloea sp.]